MTAAIKQLELIAPELPVSETRLVAEVSPRTAYYIVAVFRLPGAGYEVRKSSGADKAKPNIESWYRPGLRAALEKKGQLIAGKLNKKRGRIYVEMR